jgi:hypothetical protein
MLYEERKEQQLSSASEVEGSSSKTLFVLISGLLMPHGWPSSSDFPKFILIYLDILWSAQFKLVEILEEVT